MGVVERLTVPPEARVPPRSVTKTEAAFLALRVAIEDGVFRPGEHLRLNSLIEMLDMSVTPIREALRLLQAEGLVEHNPHRGVMVAEFSTEQVEEIYRLRSVLEPLATELAVERATDAQVAEMLRLHETLREAVEASEARTDMAQLNQDWHRTVYAASGSRYLMEFIARLWTAIPLRAVWLIRRSKTSVAQHEKIMRAIDRRDAPAAAELMRTHIESGADSTIRHLRELAEQREG